MNSETFMNFSLNELKEIIIENETRISELNDTVASLSLYIDEHISKSPIRIEINDVEKNILLNWYEYSVEKSSHYGGNTVLLPEEEGMIAELKMAGNYYSFSRRKLAILLSWMDSTIEQKYGGSGAVLATEQSIYNKLTKHRDPLKYILKSLGQNNIDDVIYEKKEQNINQYHISNYKSTVVEKKKKSDFKEDKIKDVFDLDENELENKIKRISEKVSKIRYDKTAYSNKSFEEKLKSVEESMSMMDKYKKKFNSYKSKF